ncbi:tetratricopeptide repeat protein [Streptomyces sp. NBC_01613]|uniref:tetratricopeptide repeat protein n=1 Tax=Streptomyces sp. NBC_01613 TaxID=2975896 RepID=UPI00386DC227
MAEDGPLGVVLVHGFKSGPQTWHLLEQRIAADDSLTFVRTLPFAYATGIRRIHPLRVFPSINAIADSLREYLRTEADGFEKLMLITHSMGGLVVQRYLARMLADGHGLELARIRRVVLLACPNDGAELLLSLRRSVFGRTGHGQESQLQPLNEQVSDTRRVIVRDIVYATTVTERTCPIAFSAYAGDSDRVVSLQSARSVFPDAAALPGDHFTILKATTPNHRTFTTLHRLMHQTRTSPDPGAGAGLFRAAPAKTASPPSFVGPDDKAIQPSSTAATITTGGTQLGMVTRDSNVNVNVEQAATHTRAMPLAGLPPRSRTFTGRDEDVQDVLTRLSPQTGDDLHGPALVQAVIGMGGVGKTELVLQTAYAALHRTGWFPGGVLFIDLNGYDPDPEGRVTPTNALDVLLRALGTPPEDVPPDEPSRSVLLRSVLARRAEQDARTLLIMDNAGTENQVLPLLPSDPTTPVLITSRATLGIGACLHVLDVLQIDASVDLIRQDLQQALGPGDTRVDDAPDQVARIADLCGGLPLALRIVAALLADTPHRPLSSMADALHSEHTRLSRLRRVDRAVQAAFDLSYQNLTEDEAHLFRMLPLNPGLDLSTRAATCLVGECDSHVTERLLTDLARAHLIDPAAEWGRWRMHDLLRLYADHLGRQHAADDQRDTVRDRLLDYYLATAQDADIHLQVRTERATSSAFSDREQALAWLDIERTNLTAAATGAPANHPVCTDMAFALNEYLNFRRHFDDLITLTTQAVGIFREAGNRLHEAGAFNNLGTALRQVRRFDEAITAHTTAAGIFRKAGDRLHEAGAFNNLGIALCEVRRFEEAITAHTTAADIYREADARLHEAGAFNNLGTALREVRRFEEAITAHTTAADIYREADARHSEAMALNNLGLALQEMRRFEEAITAHTEAADIYRQTADRHSEGTAMDNLGLARRELGWFEEAITAHTEAADIYRQTADRHSEGNALNNLGAALQKAGRLEEAITAHTTAADIFREAGDRHSEAMALTNLGVVLTKVEQFEEAITAHTTAADVYRQANDRHSEAIALNNLGLALQEVSKLEEAITAHTEAANLYRQTDDRHSEGNASNNLGAALQKAGRLEEAITAHTTAADIFREAGDRHSEAMALGSLGVVLPEAGRFEEGLVANTNAVEMFREAGDRVSEAMAWDNQGAALQKAGRFEEAVAAHTKAARVFRESGVRHLEAIALNNLSVAMGMVSRARDL